jgi:hypothetical protein
MPKMNISEAARMTGKARQTIHRHIDRGRLTKEIDATGNPVVDVAELERVYGPLQHPGLSHTVTQRQPDTPSNDNLLQRELELLREERARERGQFCQQLEDLRQERDRLLKVIEEQAGSVRLLTDQRLQRQPKRWRWFWQRWAAGTGATR